MVYPWESQQIHPSQKRQVGQRLAYVALNHSYGMQSLIDKVFHKANAYYHWTKGIIITCPEVKHPVAVRYGFRNFLIGNVANAAHLPLFPWRSDNW